MRARQVATVAMVIARRGWLFLCHCYYYPLSNFIVHKDQIAAAAAVTLPKPGLVELNLSHLISISTETVLK